MGSWPRLSASDWDEMFRRQQEAARNENGSYQGAGPTPRLIFDEVVALCMYWERSFGSADTWSRDSADTIIVNLARVDQNAKPTRKLTDGLEVGEALSFWAVLLARSQQLDPLCGSLPPTVPGTGPQLPSKVGFCPGDFRYDGGTTAQMRRAMRVGEAIQRKLKPIKPPPFTDIIGALLGLLPWLVLFLLVAAEGEPRWKRRRR